MTTKKDKKKIKLTSTFLSPGKNHIWTEIEIGVTTIILVDGYAGRIQFKFMGKVINPNKIKK